MFSASIEESGMVKRMSETAMLGAAAETIRAATSGRAPLNMKLLDPASTKDQISVEEMLARADKKGGDSTVLLPFVESEGNRPLLLDPAEITHSRYANRLPENFQGAIFDELKESIRLMNGNVQPIKVRRISSPAGNFKYEVVFGHRRHAACLQLGVRVKAFCEPIDDRSLFLEMDRENRGRADLSAWEQGLSYVNALDSGLFPSARKLAEALGADLTNVGRAISIGKLPQVVVDAFSSPLDIQFRHAKPLKDAIEANPDLVFSKAKRIKQDGLQLSGSKVVEVLTSTVAEGGSTVLPPKALNAKINGKGGQRGEVSIDPVKKSAQITLTNVDPNRFAEIKKMVEAFVSGTGEEQTKG
jgi:ParB family chromosome partitioning protein